MPLTGGDEIAKCWSVSGRGQAYAVQKEGTVRYAPTDLPIFFFQVVKNRGWPISEQWGPGGHPVRPSPPSWQLELACSVRETRNYSGGQRGIVTAERHEPGGHSRGGDGDGLSKIGDDNLICNHALDHDE